jgi:hypothetical protein
MLKTNLKSMPYAQATVIITDEIVLRSYQTDVIIVTADGWLVCTGTYSATTRRHIGAFMREYGYGDYQLAKMLYKDGMKMNIHTGEVVPY